MPSSLTRQPRVNRGLPPAGAPRAWSIGAPRWGGRDGRCARAHVEVVVVDHCVEQPVPRRHHLLRRRRPADAASAGRSIGGGGLIEINLTQRKGRREQRMRLPPAGEPYGPVPRYHSGTLPRGAQGVEVPQIEPEAVEPEPTHPFKAQLHQKAAQLCAAGKQGGGAAGGAAGDVRGGGQRAAGLA
eukprot:scaffold454_cov124-Isochrysis_galbana.AAC.22